MEQKKITLEEIYHAIKNLQREVSLIRGNAEENKITNWEDVKFLADEKSLGETWLSKEDEEAFAYLQ